MSRFIIHVTNSEFTGQDSDLDYDRAEDALAAGVRSGVAIVTDEIIAGKASAAAEICIEAENGSFILRSVVTLSVAPLLIEKPAPTLLVT